MADNRQIGNSEGRVSLPSCPLYAARKLAYQLPAASVGLPFLMFKTDAWLNIHFHISRYVSNVKHSCTMDTVTRRRKSEKRWRKKKEDGEEKRTGTSGN